MKISRKLYYATSAEHVNTIEGAERIRPSADGYVHLATEINVAVGLAISKGYDRIVVFKVDPSRLDTNKLQSVGGGSYRYWGDIQAPALVHNYRTPPPEVTKTLAGVATQIEAWLAILPPEQHGTFLARLMQEGRDVVDHTVVDAIGRSLLEE